MFLKYRNLLVLFLFLVFFLSESNVIAQDLNVFYLIPYEKTAKQTVGFISMSDVYFPSESPDSAAIPSMELLDTVQSKHFYLDSIYRKRFLEGTHITPTDSVFIYNYESHLSASFSVKSLKVIAKLNDYRSDDEYPHQAYDYQIGFEIPSAIRKKLCPNYFFPLVCIGKKNPFIKGQMKPIVWTKVPAKEFPPYEVDTTNRWVLRNVKRGTTYRATLVGYTIFAQDILSNENDNLAARQLIVTDSKTNTLVRNDCFYDSESTMPAPLNLMTNEKMINQFVGRLFKGKPPVIMGFEYMSFGCDKITFLKKDLPPVYINCDNRH